MRYAIIVFWSDQEGARVADVPDLKSCSAFGDTPEEAVTEVRVAMEGVARRSPRCRSSDSGGALSAAARGGRVAIYAARGRIALSWSAIWRRRAISS